MKIAVERENHKNVIVPKGKKNGKKSYEKVSVRFMRLQDIILLSGNNDYYDNELPKIDL